MCNRISRENTDLSTVRTSQPMPLFVLICFEIFSTNCREKLTCNQVLGRKQRSVDAKKCRRQVWLRELAACSSSGCLFNSHRAFSTQEYKGVLTNYQGSLTRYLGGELTSNTLTSYGGLGKTMLLAASWLRN